ERLHRGNVVLQARRRRSAIERVDVVAPLLKRGETLVTRPVRVSDIVDLAAEAVDLEHRLALRRRQDAHRRIERPARGRRAVLRVGRRRFAAHAPAAVFDCAPRPTARRAVSPAMAPKVWISNSNGDRCTRSLRGSRTFSIATILSANIWMTETS